MIKGKKIKSIFVCQSCGHESAKWLGKCPGCGEWSSFVEERGRGEDKGGGGALRLLTEVSAPREIMDVERSANERTGTGIAELDRVLGGGIVPGSSILVGGDPGIGKSTLLLQAMSSYAGQGKKVLYVTGEESVSQIRLRAERLGALPRGLLVWAETSIERIMDTIKDVQPDVVVIDSVQTMFTNVIESSPGTVGQLRESSARLVTVCKSLNVPLFLIGHVTKEGAIAGPKVLEHMVDTVLYFEGKSSNLYRILRAVKNRFGSVMEIGVFEMKHEGLIEVANPSEVFLQDRPEGASGSAVVPSLEGTRSILVELQSLVSTSVLGVPRRTVVGVDHNKVMLLVAVLEKKAGITLNNHDIFLKVAGGIRLDEPAIDLGVLSSLASSFLDKPINPKSVILGEVGLAGEVRAVTRIEARVEEARKLGFTSCVLPYDNLKGLKKRKGMELKGVKNVREAMDVIFEG
jgi:DNA repair protein RadA/Sms